MAGPSKRPDRHRRNNPSPNHPFTPLPSPLGRGKRGRGVAVRGLVEATGAIPIPEIVKLRLPPRQSRGVSRRTSAAKGHCASAGSHHGRFFMPWVRAIAIEKPTAQKPCRGYLLWEGVHFSKDPTPYGD